MYVISHPLSLAVVTAMLPLLCNLHSCILGIFHISYCCCCCLSLFVMIVSITSYPHLILSAFACPPFPFTLSLPLFRFFLFASVCHCPLSSTRSQLAVFVSHMHTLFVALCVCGSSFFALFRFVSLPRSLLFSRFHSLFVAPIMVFHALYTPFLPFLPPYLIPHTPLLRPSPCHPLPSLLVHLIPLFPFLSLFFSLPSLPARS